MSDITTLPPGSPPAGPTLTTEQVTAMRNAWVSQGLDAADFDFAAGLKETDTGSDGINAAGGSENPSTAVPGVVTEPFTSDQLLSMAADLIGAGLDTDRVREALDADLEAQGLQTDLVEDERSEEEIEFDRLYPRPEPDSYRPDYYGKVPEGTAPEALAEYDAIARTWAASMDLCPEVGSHIIGEALRIGQALGQADDVDRALYIREQRVLFERISGGPEAAAARIATAGKLLARAPKAFTDGLRASGALHSAEIVNALANEAERLALRG